MNLYILQTASETTHVNFWSFIIFHIFAYRLLTETKFNYFNHEYAKGDNFAYGCSFIVQSLPCVLFVWSTKALCWTPQLAHLHPFHVNYFYALSLISLGKPSFHSSTPPSSDSSLSFSSASEDDCDPSAKVSPVVVITSNSQCEMNWGKDDDDVSFYWTK